MKAFLSPNNRGESEGAQIVDVLQQAVTQAQEHIEKLERAQANGARKRMDVKNANMIGNRRSSPESYKNSMRYDYPDYKELARRARAHIEELKAESKRIHEENKEALANNIAIRDAITTMMEQIGFYNSYTTYEYKSKRSRNKREVKHTAGWRQDMQRWLSCDDGYSSVEGAYTDAMKSIDQWEEKQRIEADRERLEGEAKAQAEEQRMKKAVLIAKYKLPHTADSWDILTHILEQDRYLKLAHYLHQNRCDWNDGYHYARLGIDGFVPVTDADKLMIESLRDFLEDLEERGEVDGRYFRDCEYNYTVIFDMVENAELFDDFETARDLAGLL